MEMTVSQLARMGGQAKYKKYGRDHYMKMSQKGIEAKKKKALVHIAAKKSK